MSYQLHPVHPVLWSTDTVLQVGVGSAALTIGHPDAVREALIDALANGATMQTLTQIARANGGGPEQVRATLALLGDRVMHCEIPLARTRPQRLPKHLHLDVWRRTLRYRAQATVQLSGLGPLGRPVAEALVADGVRHFQLDDSQLVPPYQRWSSRVQRGDTWEWALAKHLMRMPGVRADLPAMRRPDLAVLYGNAIIAPHRWRHLMHEDITHLPVIGRHDGTIDVGDPIIPGATPCMGCQALHLQDRHPHQRYLDAQMANLPALQPSPIAMLRATAEVVERILRHLDAAVRDDAAAGCDETRSGHGASHTTLRSQLNADGAGPSAATDGATAFHIRCMCRANCPTVPASPADDRGSDCDLEGSAPRGRAKTDAASAARA